jgi:predicted ribosome quality control (RQC) complex YloA/Tae2 family protein
MLNNYFFLRQLSKKLAENYIGYTLVSCFSQNKDEIVIELNNEIKSFFIRADLSSEASCLSFPDHFKRANKNSIDLFSELVMRKITCVHQFENERSFEIQFEEDWSLLFKMHGKFSNLLLFESENLKSHFRNNIQNDLNIKRKQLERTIDWSRENFTQNQDRLKEMFPVLGKEPWVYLKSIGFDELSGEEKWRHWEDMLHQLKEPLYYICRHQGKLIFSLLPLGDVLRTFSEPLKAITEFYFQFVTTGNFENKKHNALSEISKKIKSTESFLSKNKAKLQEIEQDHHYQTWGDLLMAHLYEIKQGATRITLSDFYTGEPTEIKLKPELNAQKNAELFYRKSKNQQIEIDKLKESIHQKENELLLLIDLQTKVDTCVDLPSLNKLTDSFYKKDQAKEKIKKLPYHEFEFKDFKIWVGKNAEANDELTHKYSFKEDLWLHAKDVAGSHVLIKHQSGKVFPKDVIEHAASLAAHYSKRKNESLCPVAFTPKKFVRKRKGDPAGMVIVEKEEVILVEPKKS